MTTINNHKDPLELLSENERMSRTIVSLKAKESRKKTWSQKMTDILAKSFGTIIFLIVNILWFALWIFINLGGFENIPIFDPFPFNLLATLVSFEAIFLSIIVLISQNRAARIEELRQEVDLYINTISEKEITKIIEMLTKIMEYNRLSVTDDAVLREMLKPTDVKKIEENLNKQL